MKKKEYSGPSTEPCSTPESTGRGLPDPMSSPLRPHFDVCPLKVQLSSSVVVLLSHRNKVFLANVGAEPYQRPWKNPEWVRLSLCVSRSFYGHSCETQ